MRIFVRIIILFLVIIFAVALWAGLLRKVTVDEVTPESWHGVYALHKGSFSKINESIADVEKYVASKNVKSDKTFGIYFQDPSVTPEALLVSWAGVSTGSEVVPVVAPYNAYTFESKKYVHAQFIGHPIMGVFRVYPKLKSYLKLHQYSETMPIMETYTPGSYGQMIIDYYVELKSL